MRSSWRTVLVMIAGVVAAVFVAGVFWLVHSSRNQVGTANVYAVYLAAATLGVTVLTALSGWSAKGPATAHDNPQAQISEAADLLAKVTEREWRLQASKRRIRTPASVRVMWHRASDELTASRAEVIAPPAPGTGPPPLPALEGPGKLLDSGAVTKLFKEVYARLPHGRLVLIGGAGAGKTGAMILLLLDVLGWRASLTPDQRERVPVPVWLTLGGWNPPTTPLYDWVKATMDRDYPDLRRRYGADVMGELLRDGRVALFLDGLDEMPEEVRPPALECLDEQTRGLLLRFVVTSRPQEYRSAVQTGMPANTATIELVPVTRSAAARYLLGDQAGPRRQQWEKISAYLAHNPGSVAAQALDNPLTLSLARDTYTRPDQDPTVLADTSIFPNVEAVREHLLDHFLITAYPDEREQERALSWLGWLACHMGTGQDLQWWNIPGWIPEWKLRFTRGLATGLAVGLAAGIGVIAFGHAHSRPAGLYAGLVAGLAAGLVSGLASRLRAKPGDERRTHARPGSISPTRELLERPLVRGIVAGIVAGNLLALAATARGAGIVFSLTSGLVVGLAAGVVAGLAFGFGARLGFGLAGAPQTLVIRRPRARELAWIMFPPMFVPMVLNLWATPIADSRSTPAGTYRADRRASLTYGLVYGSAFGLLAALAAAFTNGYGQGLAYGLLSALGWGLVAGLAVWLAAWLAAGQVPLVKLTELILIAQRQNRVCFLDLLEGAFDRQVLRQAGALYQFRHAALQAHLAEMYCPLTRPAVAATPSTADGIRSGVAGLLAVGWIINVIPLCIYVLVTAQATYAEWPWMYTKGPWWVIAVASTLGIVVTLGGVRQNTVCATVLLCNLVWNVVYSLTLIKWVTPRPSTLTAVLSTQSAIECLIGAAVNVALCVWIIILRSNGTHKVDPVLAVFAGCFSLALIFAFIAWASRNSPVNPRVWDGVALLCIVTALVDFVAAIRALSPDLAGS